MRVGGPFDKIEMPVEFACAIVLGMSSNRPDSGDIGSLQGPHDCVLQKTCAKSFPMMANGNAQPGKDHQRYWMPREALHQAFGSIPVIDMADNERVETDNLVAIEGDICLRGTALLPLPRKA